MGSIKEQNINIFNDTMYLIEHNPKLMEAVNSSNERQQYILEFDEVKYNSRFKETCTIKVTKNSSFNAARNYDGEICVLNFASATNPGGGVTKGSSAQEECLCRCSTLYKNLIIENAIEKFYKPHKEYGNALHNDDIIYTPGVTIIKSDNYNKLYQNKVVNVITCAAPNLRETPANAYNHEHGEGIKISDSALLEIHVCRARRILSVAAANNNDHVILGAFGCGAFRNKPEIVAEAYKIVLPEFAKCFKTIEFAVFCRDDTTNYDVFNSILG